MSCSCSVFWVCWVCWVDATTTRLGGEYERGSCPATPLPVSFSSCSKDLFLLFDLPSRESVEFCLGFLEGTSFLGDCGDLWNFEDRDLSLLSLLSTLPEAFSS